MTVRAEYYSLLPHTLDTRRVYLPPAAAGSARGSFATGFELSEPLRSGQRVYLEEEGEALGAGRTVRAEVEIWEGEAFGLEGRELLQVPAGLSERLRALAGELADPAGDPTATLERIEGFLSRHCTYSLKVGRTPPGVEFVEHFLFDSRVGYCVHFATAFVVLARLNGIPARYVAGFLVPSRPSVSALSWAETAASSDPSTPVTGFSAHAWPEVFLSGQGWTVWEATPAVNPSSYQEVDGNWLYGYAAGTDRLTRRQLRYALGREAITDLRATRPARRVAPLRGAAVRPALALLGAVLGLLVFWALRYYAFLWWAPLRPQRRRALRMLRRIVGSRRLADLPRPAAVGWTAWARELDRRSPAAQGGSRVLVSMVHRLAYSTQPARRRDLLFLRAFYLRHCTRLSRGNLGFRASA